MASTFSSSQPHWEVNDNLDGIDPMDLIFLPMDKWPQVRDDIDPPTLDAMLSTHEHDVELKPESPVAGGCGLVDERTTDDTSTVSRAASPQSPRDDASAVVTTPHTTSETDSMREYSALDAAASPPTSAVHEPMALITPAPAVNTPAPAPKRSAPVVLQRRYSLRSRPTPVLGGSHLKSPRLPAHVDKRRRADNGGASIAVRNVARKKQAQSHGKENTRPKKRARSGDDEDSDEDEPWSSGTEGSSTGSVGGMASYRKLQVQNQLVYPSGPKRRVVIRCTKGPKCKGSHSVSSADVGNAMTVFSNHLEKKNGGKQPCVVKGCDEPWQTYTSLVRHMFKDHLALSIVCPHAAQGCTFKTNRLDKLKKHLKKDH